MTVEGTVQGVGFRPFVYGLAHQLGLVGFVGNDDDGVFIEVEGPVGSLDRFVAALRRDAPPLAVVERVSVTEVPPTGEVGFSIVPSETHGTRHALVPADVATCADCLAEVGDQDDRRAGYPFTNCTNCGPRYSIIRDVPYDRPATTMAGFGLCTACWAEYHDPTDRRFHAQPVCCPVCGPSLSLTDAAGHELDGDPIARTAASLRDGSIVAIKGLGGYHLAADARHPTAAATLRERKHREDKPFALMVRDVAAATQLCVVSATEQALLSGPERPIVLLPRRADAAAPVTDSVAPGNRSLGVMLPYTPLHHLLLAAHGGPLVLTSGNLSDEPIAFRDEDARARLSTVADVFLTHDRPIHVRVDDSVTRVLAGRPAVLRRSRGYVPRAVTLPFELARPVLAVGPMLKNTICVAKGRRAFVSQHIGDLENLETLQAFEQAIDHLCRLFDVAPEVVAHDLHPGYLSTQHVHDRLEHLPSVGVQHHHAHVASCLVDNGVTGPVVGVAFDGTGYGSDGTIWGGEILVGDLEGFTRAAHLTPVSMPGGEAAVREPWRMALAHLVAAYGTELPDDLAVIRRHGDRWGQVRAVAESGLHAPLTTSAGRLFDAVAALVGVRDHVTYEGQAAIELEQHAGSVGGSDGYPVVLEDGTDEGPFTIALAPLVRGVVEDLRGGVGAGQIAGRFHAWLARATVAACLRTAEAAGLSTVALSGGVFQNALLIEQVVAGLDAHGLRVLTHRQVPPNDGGISLGQVAVAGARDLAGTPNDPTVGTVRRLP